MNVLRTTARRRAAASIACMLTLSGLLAACNEDTAGGSGGETYTLRIATGLPPTHALQRRMFEPWAKYVEEQTDGTVKVQIFSGETLGTQATALGDLRGGKYDVGTVNAGYFSDSGTFPLTIGALVFASPDVETGNELISKFYDEFFSPDTVDGVIIPGAAVSDPYGFFSKKPIRSVEDLKGTAFRVSKPGDVPLAQAWGATPVEFPTGEAYEAAQRGQIDVLPYAITGVVSTKFYEVVPNLTDLGLWSTVMMPAMSKRFFDKLSPELQEQFTNDLLPKLVELNQRVYPDERAEVMDKIPDLIKDAGGEVVELDESEKAKFRAAAKPQWDAWVKEANEKGYDGEAMRDFYLKLLDEAGAPRPY